jgi:hypothetical protein
MAGKRIFVFALFALVAVAFALSAEGGAEAQTFKPVNGYSLTDSTPGANSNSTLFTGVPAPDLNLEDASSINLNPIDGYSATGLEAPIGAGVGTLAANAAVGLLGNPCNSAITPNFNLYNASVDISDQLGPGDGDGDGKGDTEWILKEQALWPVPKSQGNPQLEDYLEKYPWFLNTMLDPDGSGPLLPIQPRARFAGHDDVVGFNVIVQFLVFTPGQVAGLGGIFSQLTADKGAASLIILDNPIGEGEATPGAIADFCTPLSTTTPLLGVTTDNTNTTTVNESGYTRQANPAANTGVRASGTHMAYYYVQSERNIDNDPFENDFDACRYTDDLATWNPRVGPSPPCTGGSQPGDQDCDMLPTSCDPDDHWTSVSDNGKDTDEDADGYDNAQDNCPLVANGCKDSGCHPDIFDPTWDNQEDTDSGLVNADLGPRSDALGDACDDSDDSGNEDGAGVGTCNDGIDNPGGDTLIDGNDPDCVPQMDRADPPVTGNPVDPQNGEYYHGLPWAAECVGGVDADNDGYCLALETALGSSDADGPETAAECTNNTDDPADGDAVINDGCPRVGKYSESGAECLNNVSDDSALDANDLGRVNDGCPMIGGPESLVIDAAVTAAAALPSAAAKQSCTDLIDNDNNNGIDTDNEPLGCNPAHASYASDADRDGVADGSDNCPAAWNPTQTNSDGAADGGDVCDADDDNDTFPDTVEYNLPTDPLDNCPHGTSPTMSDAWPLDMNTDRAITVPGDVLRFAGKLGSEPGATPPTSWVNSRLDLNADGAITVPGDVLKYAGKLGGECTD